jgi:hypothetical protein
MTLIGNVSFFILHCEKQKKICRKKRNMTQGYFSIYICKYAQINTNALLSDIIDWRRAGGLLKCHVLNFEHGVLKQKSIL